MASFDNGDHLSSRAQGETGRSKEHRIVGGYELTRLLGRGGMAEVWLGVHETSRGLAAVKILRTNTADVVRDFFQREQRALLRLRHPNIVPIFDFGDDYIAAAYVEGVDLRHRMRSPLPPSETVAIIRAVGSALAAAHQQGVIHCDVKPANILIDRSGTPFLADFGIAKLVNEPGYDEAILRAGTPAYMAPEQARGEAPTPSSDQYSLARTLLVVLVGQRLPNRSMDALDLLPDELGQALAPILTRALAERPEERYESVQDLVDALRAASVSDLQPPDLLVSLKRDFKQFAWVVRPTHVEQYGESIYRADYSLSDLEGAGLLDSQEVRRFCEETGHADFTWTMYAREERLGPLTHPFALARARETVVLLHGLFTHREVWRDVAVGIARDNGFAVALTPDLIGFGDSPLAEDAPAVLCSPERFVTSTSAWLELIGLGKAPTVMLGHSISASALLCAREAELGPEVQRICVTPALPSQDRSSRMTALLYRFTALGVRGLPQGLLRSIARLFFQRDPSLQRISPSARDEMAESALRLGVHRVAHLLRWLEIASFAPPDEMQSCTVVTTHDDPLVATELAEKTIQGAGIPEERRYQLVFGGHFPHLIDEQHPAWSARTVHELVSVIDTVLDMTHEASSRVARQSANTMDLEEFTESTGTVPDITE